MVSNRMTEGVGKKIVEALKKQTDVEITSMDEELDTQSAANSEPFQSFEFFEEDSQPEVFAPIESETYEEPELSTMNLHIERAPHVENTTHFEQAPRATQPASQPINNTSFKKPDASFTENYASDFEDFELPQNVDVLKQLITKLPAGVSKQTGAIIIKQTMEALGISMKTVLQEAQQIQENLNNSARECQTNVMEYKRQISILEKQSQKYQRQYASLNDVISLFIQTGN